MVKLEMLVAGLPDSGVDLTPVDFAAVTTAIGIRAWRVSEPGGIGDALAHDGPALVDLVTDSNALSIPPVPRRRSGARVRPGRHQDRP
jgi:pyruvate dehydrogenase (quinone)